MTQAKLLSKTEKRKTNMNTTKGFTDYKLIKLVRVKPTLNMSDIKASGGHRQQLWPQY